MVFNATFNNISFNFNFMTEQYKIKASEWQNWLNILLIQQHFVDLHEGMIHALCWFAQRCGTMQFLLVYHFVNSIEHLWLAQRQSMVQMVKYCYDRFIYIYKYITDVYCK